MCEHGAFTDEVGYGLVFHIAVGASFGVRSVDLVEVVIEWGMT